MVQRDNATELHPQDFVNEIGNTHEYLGAIDWHSYTQLILRPFGYQASNPRR
jgi:hypothetical protein